MDLYYLYDCLRGRLLYIKKPVKRSFSALTGFSVFLISVIRLLHHKIQEVGQHFVPPGPVVVYVVPPDVEPDGDVLLCEERLEMIVAREQVVFPRALPDHKDDLAASVVVKPGVIPGDVRKVLDGRIRVDVRIVDVAEEIAQVVNAADREDALEQVGAS